MKRKTYISPSIETIMLDYAISLSMESGVNPDVNPSEISSASQATSNKSPFRMA